MEKQTLPNSTLVLVFGILSIIGIFCCGTGIIFAVITLVMARSAMKTYYEDPELYTGESNVKIGKILAWIAVALFVISLIWFIISLVQVGGMEAMEDRWEEIIEQAEQQQELQESSVETE